jgi:hypothetical protein
MRPIASQTASECLRSLDSQSLSLAKNLLNRVQSRILAGTRAPLGGQLAQACTLCGGSPGRRVGKRTLSMKTRKLRPLIGPSVSDGAVISDRGPVQP